MVDVEVRAKPEAEAENAAITQAPEPTPSSIPPRRSLRMFPLLITLATIVVAVLLGRAM